MSTSKSIQIFIDLIKNKKISPQSMNTLRKLAVDLDFYHQDLETIDEKLLAWLEQPEQAEIAQKYDQKYDELPPIVVRKGDLGFANTHSPTPVDQSSQALKDQLINTIHQNPSPSDSSQSQSSLK